MNSNKLKFNPPKTEFIVFSSAGMRKRLEPFLLCQILRERFEAAKSVWNLDVIFDCDFFKKQVDTVGRSCFEGLRDLQRIRKYLP